MATTREGAGKRASANALAPGRRQAIPSRSKASWHGELILYSLGRGRAIEGGWGRVLARSRAHKQCPCRVRVQVGATLR
eukprot:2619559-Pleurochrysis_carterae.AAC.2